MIVECPKCNKKFDLDESLIPSKGRLLQCGNCHYKWMFLKSQINETFNDPLPPKTEQYKIESLDDEVKPTAKKERVIETVEKSKEFKKKNNNDNSFTINSVLSYLLVLIITTISLIILLDTFKQPIKSFIPNIDFYLSSLYESLRDIYLFFKDLLK